MSAKNTNTMKIKIAVTIASLLLLITSCDRKIRDKDNNIYDVAIFNNQVWMTENLRVIHFRNGDPIVEAKSVEDWIYYGENGIPAWCYYDNLEENDKLNGKLYNWYALTDPRGLAPSGWSIPSFGDWMHLIEDLGRFSSPHQWHQELDINEFNSRIEELKRIDALKRALRLFYFSEIGFKDGSRKVGFQGNQSGIRNYIGEFKFGKELGIWWTETEINDFPIVIIRGRDDLTIQQSTKLIGCFVRCFRPLK